MKRRAYPGIPVAAAAVLLGAVALPARAVVERYKDEALYLARLAELGYESLQEDFEGSDWDGVRSNYPVQNFAPSVSSKGITWTSAGQDLWTWPGTAALISTNQNWARGTGWGIFDNYLASTKRITTSVPIYGIGFWVKTNPGGQDIGILFEDRTTATEPGYVLPGYGAMYPGDINPFGHEFVGFIDPDGFTEVIVTGTLEVNEESQLEGGTVFGADDFTFAVPAGFLPTPLEAWRTQHFSAADLADPAKEATVWGNGADPDGDGASNWYEYLFGGVPVVSDALAMELDTEMVFEGGEPFLQFSFNRRTNDPTLVYSPKISSETQGWQGGSSYVVETGIVTLNPAFERVSVRDLGAAGGRVFGRVEVSINQ